MCDVVFQSAPVREQCYVGLRRTRSARSQRITNRGGWGGGGDSDGGGGSAKGLPQSLSTRAVKPTLVLPTSAIGDIGLWRGTKYTKMVAFFLLQNYYETSINRNASTRFYNVPWNSSTIDTFGTFHTAGRLLIAHRVNPSSSMRMCRRWWWFLGKFSYSIQNRIPGQPSLSNINPFGAWDPGISRGLLSLDNFVVLRETPECTALYRILDPRWQLLLLLWPTAMYTRSRRGFPPKIQRSLREVQAPKEF